METKPPKKSGILERLLPLIRDLGLGVTFIYLFDKLVFRLPCRLKLRTQLAQFPVYARLRTSDLNVFRQIFLEREFTCIDDLQNPALIIDCGANVGYSAVYFLSRYPNAFVIAVEPDTGNFGALQSNLAPYAGRFKVINSAIWSKRTGLRISETPLRDEQEWSITVREAQPGETAQLQALTINDILKESGHDRISLLKIDVEGAEKEIFSGELEPWLSKTDMMTVELHTEELYRIFETAVAPQHFKISTWGELTICRRA